MAKYKALATMYTYMYYEFEADSMDEAWDKAEKAGDDGLYTEELEGAFEIDEVQEVYE